MLSSSGRIADLILFIVAAHNILHDTSAFEDTNLLAVVEGVSDSWNAAIRIDFGEPVGLLLVYSHVDFPNVVR